jgi:hypothetical protein
MQTTRLSGSTRRYPGKSLVIGTVRDAGRLVYDIAGRLLRAIRPPHAPHALPNDPATPSCINLAPDDPCDDSHSDDSFGRFPTSASGRISCN